MSEDLVSFKMLVASDVGPERDLLRECAGKAALPVDYIEFPDPIDPTALRETAARETLDFIFVSSRVAKADRRAIHAAALANTARPLVIFVGPPDVASLEMMPGDATADGVLIRPVRAREATAVIGMCARARLTKQLLLVDDSATMRAVIRKVLQTSRFRLDVAEAGDGQSAVEQAGKRRFDLVFLDCQMPGIDGFATLDLLKRAQRDLHVVMIAETRDQRLEDRARAAGADDFLFKPFFADDVDAVLRRLLGLAVVKAA